MKKIYSIALAMLCICMSVSAQTTMDGKFVSSSVSATSLTVTPQIRLSSLDSLDVNIFVFTISNFSKVTSITTSSMDPAWTGYSLNANYDNTTGICSLTITAPVSRIAIPTSFTDLCTVVFANSGTSSDNTDLTWNTNSLQAGISAGTFTDKSNEPLPVNIVSFKGTAQNGKNLLIWQTAAEQNADYFSVERSFDGINFVPIAQIKAVGTSNTLQTYSFTDMVDEFCYYRLIEVDLNGRTEKFTTITVGQQTVPVISIFPNPVANNLILSGFPSGKTVTIIDVSGRKVFVGTTSQTNIDLNGLSPGTYFFSSSDENEKPVFRTFRKQ